MASVDKDKDHDEDHGDFDTHVGDDNDDGSNDDEDDENLIYRTLLSSIKPAACDAFSKTNNHITAIIAL